MNRTSKRLNKRFIWVGILFFLIGCEISKDDKKELQSTKEVSDKIGYENNEVISFHEVYKPSDEKLIRVLESIPEIDGFIPTINSLDFQNFLQNGIVGVTDKEEKKQGIISELSKMKSIPENSFFCWSKKKQENGIPDEGYYYLYLLKNIDKGSKIENDEIMKAEVQFNKYVNESEISIKFNESGTKKWSKMTEKAAMNNNDFIAMVIDFEVYSCPSVMTPINSGEVLILGFDSKYEAAKIVERIEAMKNRKSTK